jgi:hypothetical protein
MDLLHSLELVVDLAGANSMLPTLSKGAKTTKVATTMTTAPNTRAAPFWQQQCLSDSGGIRVSYAVAVEGVAIFRCNALQR